MRISGLVPDSVIGMNLALDRDLSVTYRTLLDSFFMLLHTEPNNLFNSIFIILMKHYRIFCSLRILF